MGRRSAAVIDAAGAAERVGFVVAENGVQDPHQTALKDVRGPAAGLVLVVDEPGPVHDGAAGDGQGPAAGRAAVVAEGRSRRSLPGGRSRPPRRTATDAPPPCRARLPRTAAPSSSTATGVLSFWPSSTCRPPPRASARLPNRPPPANVTRVCARGLLPSRTASPPPNSARPPRRAVSVNGPAAVGAGAGDRDVPAVAAGPVGGDVAVGQGELHVLQQQPAAVGELADGPVPGDEQVRQRHLEGAGEEGRVREDRPARRSRRTGPGRRSRRGRPRRPGCG